MDVLVDTCIWSLALRRSNGPTDPAALALAELIRENRALLLGAVRQELLSGIKNPPSFELLRAHLRAFPDIECETADYEEAAAFSNRCRSKGIQGAAVDYLICAIASRRRITIFTTDRDFESYSRILGVSLHRHDRKS